MMLTLSFVAVSLILLVYLCLSGSLGQSDFYRSLDANSDGQLSYLEWMSYYSTKEHAHPIQNCSRSDFYLADCDGDDILTWSEYHDFRFRHRRCLSYPSFAELLVALHKKETELMQRHGVTRVDP